jgi:hypothetical protein
MLADTSHTERIRRLKAQIQAIARAASKKTLEEGPQPPVSESMRLSRSFGQMAYTRQNAAGAPITTTCCTGGIVLGGL